MVTPRIIMMKEPTAVIASGGMWARGTLKKEDAFEYS